MGRANRKGGTSALREPKSTSRTSPKQRKQNFLRLTEDKLQVHYLQNDEDVQKVADELGQLTIRSVGLDFETASKNGKYGVDNGALRLIQIGIDEPETGPQQIVVDCFRANPRPILQMLRDPKIEKQIHNMAFEQEWSQIQLGARIQNVYDTCIAFRVIQEKLKKMDEAEIAKKLPGWHQHDNRLATLMKIYMNMEMPKGGQSSDWSREKLLPDQIIYAAMDAAVMPLLTKQVKKIAEHLDCQKEVKERLRQEDRKINERVRSKKRTGEDDSTRIQRALARAASLEELDRLWASRSQMTLFADSIGDLRRTYKKRHKELLGR